LHPEQIAWIVNHAEDKMLCFDLSFLPIIEAIAPHCPTVKTWVAMCDADRMPQSKVVSLVCYEQLLAEGRKDWQWPEFDERSAVGLCYTSGTTPKVRFTPIVRRFYMPTQRACPMP
jgi:fatty-acyl-CoA synthase